MYKNILLAVDIDSEESWKRAMPAAVNACQHDDATLHVLMVVPDFGMSIVGSFFPEGYEKQALERAHEHMESFVKEHVPKGVPVEVHVGHGRPYEQILETAKRIPADLIVMGPHRPGAEDYLLGSTASRVARFAKCSVLIARN
ncbi:MAG: universal stress protein [Halofilum sp. (in: g-proteobacteria)]|nr:universal stress protein [Halofilum sp. (in: g-proteobacteria)]